MPHLKTEQIAEESILGLWHIQETEEELAFDASEQCPEELISPQKRLEWLAGRVLIKTMLKGVDLPYFGIVKDEFGKPFLRDHLHHISLSHSYPYVAAQIDSSQTVGIDLEQPKPKLLAIASRILSPTELADAGQDVTKHCVYWCAKEALYKIYGKRSLHFSNQLNIEPFTLQRTGFLKGLISANDQILRVHLEYRVEPAFVWVYTKTMS